MIEQSISPVAGLAQTGEEQNSMTLVEPNFKFDFQKVKPILTQIFSAWDEKLLEVDSFRQERHHDIDVREMRSNKEIEADETFIPDYVIESNIRREMPAFIEYITSNTRLLILKEKNAARNLFETTALERIVSSGLRYAGWYRDYLRAIDGALLHGWDYVEVIYDATKPLGVRIEHVGADNLFFNINTLDIQECPFILRRYKMTAMTLRRFSEGDTIKFTKEQVDLILQDDEQKPGNQNIVYPIFKVYFKHNGIVYVAWVSLDKCSEWLSPPVPLWNGHMQLGVVPSSPPLGIPSSNDAANGDSSVAVQEPIATTGVDPMPGIQGGLNPSGFPLQTPTWERKYSVVYPIFLYTYRESEQKEIMSKIGRGFLDSGKQEGVTAVLTSFVNALLRSSDVYGAPEKGDENDSTLKQLDIPLRSGTIFNQPFRWFHMDYPDASVLNALNYLNTSNIRDTGEMDSAVSNRKDARKTAEELKIAYERTGEQRSINLLPYSEWLRSFFAYSWDIIQQQALAGLIEIQVNPDILAREYEIKAAGDVDVILRDQLIVNMMQDWPVVSQTPLANQFLQDLMLLKYPEKGELYAQILSQGDPRNLLASLLTLLQTFISDEDLAALDPQSFEQLKMIMSQAAQVVGTLQQPTQSQPKQIQG